MKIEIRLDLTSSEIQEMERLATAMEMTLSEWIEDAFRLQKEASRECIECDRIDLGEKG